MGTDDGGVEDDGDGGGELGGAKLGDARLSRRLVRVAERSGAQPGGSIPVACSGWAETEAAYRLPANEAADREGVVAPHRDCSVERMRCHPVVSCVQDSTELDCTAQPGIAGLGPLSCWRRHGPYVHPTLAVTPDGAPLGVLDAWMWARDRETFGEDRRHRPIEAKESMRWLEGFERCAELAVTSPDTRLVHVADRECDTREFMVRDRKLAEGDRLWDRLAKAPVWGEVTFALPARPNRPSRPVVLTVRVERVTLHPQGGEPVTVTALRAREESAPVGVEPLDWRLLSNRPAATLAAAAELIQWYGCRWTIEQRFKKSNGGLAVAIHPPDRSRPGRTAAVGDRHRDPVAIGRRRGGGSRDPDRHLPHGAGLTPPPRSPLAVGGHFPARLVVDLGRALQSSAVTHRPRLPGTLAGRTTHPHG